MVSRLWMGYNSITAGVSLFCLGCVFWVSFVLRQLRSYIAVSAAFLFTGSFLYIVQASHIPMLVVALVVRRDASFVAVKGLRTY